jgi:hypothetical protein
MFMQKQNVRRKKRVRNLVAICSLTAIILSVSTYAWFIGMRTVNVTSFDVQIKSTESLALSIDGVHWDQTVSINSTNAATAFAGNTNSWGGAGLIPMSSIGIMDPAVSRMILYEKASLTTTPGGYRLLASRVHNYDGEPLNAEQNGYVAFDLFVKNFSGPQYYSELDTLNEEAIYLTTDSAVTVSADGVDNTGIENSVRVAFGQVGRVVGTTTDAAVITGITCEPDPESGLPSIIGPVTGICRTAQIWEPNDKKHVAAAISWYDTSCLPRTDADLTLKSSYTEGQHCGTVVDGTAYPTYAVKTIITPADQIDVYDGAVYNSYTASITNGKLDPYPYFTDSHKILKGTTRPQFMTLAPNSITKVRIYVYIEGQDVDNYDFASIGKQISIKFGFTKERYNPDDINYDGPPIPPEEI